jgi:hypothetical protein
MSLRRWTPLLAQQRSGLPSMDRPISQFSQRIVAVLRSQYTTASNKQTHKYDDVLADNCLAIHLGD